MCDTGRHHTAATCTIDAVLLTRIVACLRKGTTYQLRDVDGTPITAAEGGPSSLSAIRYPQRSGPHGARSARLKANRGGTSAPSKESPGAPR